MQAIADEIQKLELKLVEEVSKRYGEIMSYMVLASEDARRAMMESFFTDYLRFITKQPVYTSGMTSHISTYEKSSSWLCQFAIDYRSMELRTYYTGGVNVQSLPRTFEEFRKLTRV